MDTYFSQFWRLSSLRSRFQKILFLVKGPFPHLQVTSACYVLTWLREQALVSLFFQEHYSYHAGPTLMTSCTLNHLQKATAPNFIILGLGLQYMTGGGGGHKHSVHNRRWPEVCGNNSHLAPTCPPRTGE